MPNDVYNQTRANAPLIELHDNRSKESYAIPFKTPKEKRIHASKRETYQTDSQRGYAIFLAQANVEQKFKEKNKGASFYLTPEQQAEWSSAAELIGDHLDFRRNQELAA